MSKCLLFFLLFSTSVMLSQNIVAGHLSVKDIQSSYPLGRKATVYLAFDSLENVNKPYTLIDFGDGTLPDTALSQTSFPFYCHKIKYYTYEALHAYNNYGNYTVTCNEGNLVSGIANIPNSANQTLKLKYEVILTSQAFANISTYYGGCSYHANISLTSNSFNPLSYDSDYQDSLSYAIYNEPSLTGYIIPPFNVNYLSGNLTYTGTSLGSYLVILQITEWKKMNNVRVKIGVGYLPLHLAVTDITAGVKSNSNSRDYAINVFPNPISDILNLEIDVLNINSNFQIINSLGQIVNEEKIKDPKSQLDLSQLPSGIYTLKVFTENNYKAFKIIKE